jgi:hypothetical protein
MEQRQDGGKPLDSLDYEEFVARSFEALQLTGIGQLTRNRHFVGKSGHRHQIDIAIEIKVAVLDLLVLIECKCYRRSVEVSDVLEFVSRLHDIGASKGAMVTTVGFQEGAILLAKSHRVALITTTPERSFQIVAYATSEVFVIRRDEDGEWRRVIQPEPSAPPPEPHTTVDWYPSRGSRESFALAWRTVIATMFRDLVQDGVRDNRLHVDLRCPDCRERITDFLRGCCRSCRRPLHFNATSSVWIQCQCGKKVHRSGAETEVGICRCGSLRAARSPFGLHVSELQRLFQTLKIHT